MTNSTYTVTTTVSMFSNQNGVAGKTRPPSAKRSSNDIDMSDHMDPAVETTSSTTNNNNNTTIGSSFLFEQPSRIHHKQQQQQETHQLPPLAVSSRPTRESVMRRLSKALMRRSLTKIDLSQRGLRATDARLVKWALLQNANLSVLKLGFNDFGNAGVATLAAGIAIHGTLSSLDLGFNNVGDEGCIALASALVTATTTASSTSPVSNNRGNKYNSSKKRESSSSLHTLYLSGNSIGEEGAVALSNVIRQGCDLQRLHLTGNKIGPDGVKAITEAIEGDETRRRRQQQEQQYLQASEADSNNINNNGTEQMMLSSTTSSSENSSQLEQQQQQQHHDYFFHSANKNGFFPHNTNEESKIPPPSSSTATTATATTGTDHCIAEVCGGGGLKELFLGGTGMGPAGCVAVARLLETTSSIRILSLANCDISDLDICNIADGIKQNRERLPLESLQLSFNNITGKGVDCLMNALWGLGGGGGGGGGSSSLSSSSLKELRLDNNAIGDSGAFSVSAILPYMKTLETIDLGFNGITSIGMKKLMKVVASAPSLMSLSISGNKIDASAAQSVTYALACNRSLLYLYLDHCSIEPEPRRHIAAGLISNSGTKLRKLTGFGLGGATVSVGFPPALELWTNEKVLKFVRYMWEKERSLQQHPDDGVETEREEKSSSFEEKELDPLSFLSTESEEDCGVGGGGASASSNMHFFNGGGTFGGAAAVAVAPPGPLDIEAVAEIAKRTFASLGDNGQDYFVTRSHKEVAELSLECPVARDAIILEEEEYGGEHSVAANNSVGADPFFLYNNNGPISVGVVQQLQQQQHQGIGDIMAAAAAAGMDSSTSGSDVSSSGDRLKSSNQEHSFVVTPSSREAAAAPTIMDPEAKRRIVDWLCANMRHLTSMGNLPFNSNELWRLHQHYFSPVIKEHGGHLQSTATNTTAPSFNNATTSLEAISLSGSYDFRSSIVSEPCCGGGTFSTSSQSSDEQMTVPMSNPELPSSSSSTGPGGTKVTTTKLVSGTPPMLKRKVSYRSMCDVLQDKRPQYHQQQQQQHQQQRSAAGGVSQMIEDGAIGHSIPHGSKRARRNKSRIAYLPRIKAKLDSYLEVCHEKALILMRQLHFVEKALLSGEVDPASRGVGTVTPTHLAGVLATEAETILIDMM